MIEPLMKENLPSFKDAHDECVEWIKKVRTEATQNNQVIHSVSHSITQTGVTSMTKKFAVSAFAVLMNRTVEH